MLDNSFPALNLATFLALILITAPVCGLRPLRAALLDTEKTAKGKRFKGSFGKSRPVTPTAAKKKAAAKKSK